jgi:hypothetical protein
MAKVLRAGQAKRISCTKCGWTKRVAPHDVLVQIAYHRDIECSARSKPAERAPKARPQLSRSTAELVASEIELMR